MSRWEEAMAEISRRQFFVASIAGFSAASGWARPAGAQSVIALRVSSSMPADDNAAHYAWHQLFAANLKNAVGDRIRLDYFPNSQLGKEADVVQQVKPGFKRSSQQLCAPISAARQRPRPVFSSPRFCVA